MSKLDRLLEIQGMIAESYRYHITGKEIIEEYAQLVKQIKSAEIFKELMNKKIKEMQDGNISQAYLTLSDILRLVKES